jgi:hypothetical protein
MGLIGASAAFAAPLVKSIVVPTAAQAQASCVPQNGQCGNFDGEGCNTSTFPPCCPQTDPPLSCIHTEGPSCLCGNPGF